MPAAKYTEIFCKARWGDVLPVETESERQAILNSFNQWRKGKPGTFRAKSKKVAGGFEVHFLGQHPNEALTAANARQHGDDEL